jgi:uncharacterized protein YukJ
MPVLTDDDIKDIYNCVTIVVTTRARDNEISSMFDDDFTDPVIDRLKALIVKLEKKLDQISG